MEDVIVQNIEEQLGEMNINSQSQQASLKQQIGYGISSDVFLVTSNDVENEQDKNQVYKQFKEEYCQEDIEKEKEIHERIESKNVIKLFRSDKKGFYLEYASEGDLLEYVRRERFSEKLARTFFVQLVNGMKDIHRENIAHRDIKLDNLLLTENFELKIADFGWSTRYKGNQQMNERAGTEDIFPPEMIEYRSYYPQKVDVFLCGLVLFTMVCGMSPINYRARKNDKLYKYFANNMSHVLWKGLREKRGLIVSEEFKNIIQLMIHYDYKMRPSFNEIMDHVWIRKGDIYSEEELKEIMLSIKQKSQENPQKQVASENNQSNDNRQV